MVKRVAILGSTGSIGTQSLEVIENLEEKIEVKALVAGDNIELLEQQVKKIKPEVISVKTKENAIKLEKLFPDIDVFYGEEGLIEICGRSNIDLILAGTSGKIALRGIVKAIENKKDIALANKETLIMAGDIVMKLAKEKGVKILPVDSEHSAIFQCIKDIKDVERLIITATGGPFLNKTIEEMKSASVKDTLAHPKWNMGRKITIDSATLMNKGLEVIEAHHLFSMSYDNINVVIHPQCLIHSAIENKDGSIIAQIGVPSMHLPIQYALTYPKRVKGIKSKSFSFFENNNMTFEKPDLEKFKCLKLAYEAGRLGGTYPLCLNAVNEEAVYAFLDGKISLLEIPKLIEKELENHQSISNPSLEKLLEIDKEIRLKVRNFLNKSLQK